jgi:two-component system, OmpR family, phosphate regulon response regulator PhoB
MKIVGKILIVESNTSCAELLWKEFESRGRQPLVAFSVERAILLVERERLQAIVLRWKLPDASAMLLIGNLRAHAATSRTPVIVLGEEAADEKECIRALEAGADDYVRRPFSIAELCARVQAALRPIEHRAVHGYNSVDALTVDIASEWAFARIGEGPQELEFRLSRTCYRLLRFFVENANGELSRKDILENVWSGWAVKEGFVGVYVKLLWEALAPIRKSVLIETVPGIGCRLSSVAGSKRSPPEQQAVRALNASIATVRARRKRNTAADGRPQDSYPCNKQALVFDLRSATGTIEQLTALVQTKTEENRLLRDTLNQTRDRGGLK